MGHVTSMEDACRQGDLFAAQMFLERGDTVCIGGLPPVVIAVSECVGAFATEIILTVNVVLQGYVGTCRPCRLSDPGKQ